MKKMHITTLIVMMGLPLICLGQQNPKFVYCEIVGTSQAFSRKITIVVDFGEKMSVWADNRMKDETGKPIVFNSMIDGLNFMGKRGWLFMQAYSVSYANNGQVYHYLLSKPFDELDEETKKEFQKN